MLAAIYTLGCKVNQYETQAMEQELVRRGHTLVPFDEKADVYIVNTCSVTAVSDKKSRQMLRRCRKLNPEAVVAACGCYVQTHPEEAASLDIDLVAGTGDRMAFLELLEQVSREKQVTLLDDALKRRTFEVLPAGGMAERTRAMLKVEDGCVNFCTYCIIPYARGPVRSLPKAEAVSQTEQLRQEGYRELVLTGIEISSWGHDLKNGETLIDLLEAVSAAAGDMRLRLGSLEPRTITEDFCRRAAATGQVCRHFHLSLQSGCDRTLARMNRKYTTAEFLACVERLRRYFPGCALTADMITGFPGETEDDQAQAVAFLERVGFAAVHVFPYSRRPGTKADAMPEQLSHAVKSARAHAAQRVADDCKQRYLAQQIGQILPVLFETEQDGRWVGHSDNYCLVSVAGDDLRGVVKNVKISAISGQMLVGDLV